MRRSAGVAALCLLLFTLGHAASPPPSQPAKTDSEDSFWNDMAKPSNVTSTTTFKGDYMEYFSSGPVLYLKGSASMADSTSTLTADEITSYPHDKYTDAVGRAHLTMLTANEVKASSGTPASVQYSTVTVTSNELELFQGEKRAIATGRAQIFQNNSMIRGSRIDYNWVHSTGTVDDASGFEPPWRYSGARMIQTGPNTYDLYHARFTTCDLEFPHYFFKSSFAQMVKEKRLTGFNNFLVTDHMPIFWTPVFNHLFKQTLVLQVRPGESSRDGMVMRNNLYYSFSENNYVRVYGDYLQKTGNGYGGEVGYFSPKVKGSVYAYSIEDHNPDETPPGSPPVTVDRSTLKVAHWQQLTKTLTMQANINYQSDQDFNNNFNQTASEAIINPAIGTTSEVALTHQLPWITTRLSSVRIDSYDPNNNGALFTTDWTLPSLTFSTIPLKSSVLPFLTTLSGSYSYDKHQDFSTSPSTDTYSGQLNESFSKSMPLSPTLTFTPTLGLQENWQSVVPTPMDATPNNFTDQATETLAFRKRLTRWLDMDFGHSATIRTVVNQFFTEDSDSIDHGIENDALNLDFFAAPNSNTWARLASGYNLRTPDQDGILRGTSGDFTGPAATTLMAGLQQRIFSPNLEIDTKPQKNLEYYFHELYNVYPSLHNGVSQGRVTWNPNKRTFLQGSVEYNNGTPGALQVTTTAGFDLTQGWRLQTDLEYQVTGEDGGIHYDTLAPSAREIKLIRTIHCWQFSVHITDRPGLRQALFNIQLTSDLLATRNVSTMEEQEQLYPWRQPWKE